MIFCSQYPERMEGSRPIDQCMDPSEISLTKTNKNEEYRILIVGAGVAGLAAAGELHRRGHKDVKVEF